MEDAFTGIDMSNKPDRVVKRMVIDNNSMLNVPAKNLTRSGAEGFHGSPSTKDESTYYLNNLLEKSNPKQRSSDRQSSSGKKSNKKKSSAEMVANQGAYADGNYDIVTRNSITNVNGTFSEAAQKI